MTLCIHRIIVLQYFMTQMKETSPNIPHIYIHSPDNTVIYRDITVDIVWQSITEYFYRVTKTPAREETVRNSNPGQQNHITEGSNFFKNII